MLLSVVIYFHVGRAIKVGIRDRVESDNCMHLVDLELWRGKRGLAFGRFGRRKITSVLFRNDVLIAKLHANVVGLAVVITAATTRARTRTTRSRGSTAV